MRLLLVAAPLLLAASVAAQDRLCDDAKAHTIELKSGVIVQRVRLSGKWGRNSAMIFLPNKETVDGAVVFSHSVIYTHGGGSGDLLQFAFTLARAGAMVIVPERPLVWPPNDGTTNREGAVVFCAAHWITDHAKVFNDGVPAVNDKDIVIREGYAYVGPRLCDPTRPPDCNLIDPLAFDAVTGHHRNVVWVPVGETEGGDNTVGIISDGGLEAARWLQQHLGLAPIRELVDPPAL